MREFPLVVTIDGHVGRAAVTLRMAADDAWKP